MPINVSEALDSDTAITVSVERQVSGSYVDGLFVDGTTSNFKTLCSPQQPDSKELQTLAEGDRVKDPYKFITKKPLQTLDDKTGTKADILIFKSERYKIVKVSDWDTFGQTTSFGVREQ